MTFINSTSDAARMGWVPSLVATNLSSDETFRGRLAYDGPNAEGEMKSMILKPYYREVGRSLGREISLASTASALTAFTVDSQILTTKYTTTAVPNLTAKTAEQDGVFIIQANADPDPTKVKPSDYGLRAKRLMHAITVAKSRDARYSGPGTNAIGMAGGMPVYGFGRPYVVGTEYDLADLMYWQYGIEDDPTKMTQYANIIPGLASAFAPSRGYSVARSPMDTGRMDLDGRARTIPRSATYYQDFEILTMPPTKDGPYGPETLLYGAPGVRKINLTGTANTGKIDIIYRVVIAHSMHVARWMNFRVQPILIGNRMHGNSSVEIYDASMTLGSHRNDGRGIVMLEVRRPYNYDYETGIIMSPAAGITGLSPQLHSFGSENTSMAQAMAQSSSAQAMSAKGTGLSVGSERNDYKAYIKVGNKDPQSIDLNEIPTLQELAMPDGLGTIITGGHFKSMTH
jgi:hypothetical protein